jgi:hypothetical protein
MPQVVTQSIKLTDTITEILTFGSVSSLSAPATISPSYTYGTGVTATNIDQHFEHDYTLAAAASVTLTLSAMVDDLGRTVPFAKIKTLVISITAKTGNDFLTVGAAAANPITSLHGGTTPTFFVRTLEVKVAADTNGFAVAAGTADQLKIVNSGSASMNFTVSITGTSS